MSISSGDLFFFPDPDPQRRQRERSPPALSASNPALYTAVSLEILGGGDKHRGHPVARSNHGKSTVVAWKSHITPLTIVIYSYIYHKP